MSPGGAHRPRRGRRAPAPAAEARSSGGPDHRGRDRDPLDRFQAFVRQGSIDLTRREFELIELLAGAEGRVLEREEIYQRVWGYAMARGDRSVDVFVRKLRQKLEKASPGWRYIHTHFGVGYRFAPEPASARAPRPSRSSTALAGPGALRRRPRRRGASEHARCHEHRPQRRDRPPLAAAVAFIPGGGTTAGSSARSSRR
jgi:DNA-binding winged helix-turn-helix (wHTH) protein